MKTVFTVELPALCGALTLATAMACSDAPTPAPNGGGGGAGGTTATAGATAGGFSGSGGSSPGGSSFAGTGGASAGTGTSGGGGAGGGPGACTAPSGTPTFTQVSQILQANCGSKCHAGDAGQEHMLNLSNVDPGALHMRLTTPLQTDLCFGERPVKPGLSSTSVLVRVIKAEIGDPCVLPRMPAGCAEDNTCLSEADIATIDAWVEAGACQN
jgi:hypothetical protein